MKIRIAIVIGILYSVCTLKVFGCEYTVRDMGFVDIVPNPYRLYCFIQDATPEKTTAAFKQISYATFMDSNVRAEIINIDQLKDHPAMEYFHFWEIKSTPAAVLISPEGRSLALPIPASSITFNETIRSSFSSVISSPKREEILNHIIKAYCVILLIEGEDSAENKRIYELAARTARKIARVMSQLPKRIEEPPHIITIQKELLPKEKLLLWSLNVNTDQLNEPQAVVIYGRGRRIGPLLEGRQITGNRLLTILSTIGLSCECGLDRRWTMGPLLPLRWDKKIQSDVMKYQGFDAESPAVKMEISSIVSLNFLIQTEDEGNNKSLEDILDEYSEEVLELEGETDGTRISPAKFRELISQGSTRSKSGLNLKMVVYITVIIVLAILTGGIFIFFRARRKSS